ncbi:MAG: aminoacyl-histidine dipeptidase [Rhodocyclaceae bacterium]|nr:aminoacyl-histidine dipeptidase [Rhodocyclaceae bacterium]
MNFDTLEPAAVWRHFGTLCRIPRVSKHEQVLREHLSQWAAARGLDSRIDAGGNLLIRKAASPGMEDRAPVILQGHIDMVCQKNAGVDHDFHRDPIRPRLVDGWLVADQTTLGADNGIGVALALAALESAELRHGPLEVLLTVDEEAGMGGARNLPAGVLQGELLINLDTEEWGRFYLGCAGGMDVVAETRYVEQALPADFAMLQISIGGLVGGHSGIDIHRGRGHAIHLLVNMLDELKSVAPYRLSALEGGTARNAIPREACADIAVARGDIDRIGAWIERRQRELRQALAATDGQLTLSCAVSTTPADRAANTADQARMLDALAHVHQGVKRVSTDFAGVVETSNNLGVVRLGKGCAEAVCMVRSLIDGEAERLADETVATFDNAGWAARKTGAYPGWRPDPKSPLLELSQQVYAGEFGARAAVEVIHAGLECGLIGARYPQLDMISFGPDIRGAHAPGERVCIESVGRTWRLLGAILAAIPPRRKR